MKRIEELYKRFRFLLMAVPFLVLLLPFVGKGWSPRYWDAAVFLTQCPFVAIGHSVREDESMSGFFTIGFLVCFFLFLDRFSSWSFGHRDASLVCLGIFALMIVIEIFGIEILGWTMAKFGRQPG
ncbi:MAG: hypothetical protein WCG75_09180 [Armatimonadota bacterium]